MKILVVGGGGREHAVINALKRSASNPEIICAPGNGGIAQSVSCFNVSATDIDGMVALALRENVDLVVVTPDDPLAEGMVDAMEAAGVMAFGPSKRAAQIEASKAFAKELMHDAGILTPKARVFDNLDAARAHIDDADMPVVIKADGLARGKGVIIAMNREEAFAALDDIMQNRAFGDAGLRVLIEEYIDGTEMSVMCFSDGEHIAMMPASQDHKRLLDGDKGPNTGGMGAFARTLLMTGELACQIENNILLPAISRMNELGRKFKGVLYAGLMITERGAYVLEFNARFGDPETQVVLPLLKSDLLDIMLACCNGSLDKLDIDWSDDACAVIVLASGGYPGAYKTGYQIEGLDKLEGLIDGGVIHAGTAVKDGAVYTAGGRVLGVYARLDTLGGAIKRAYDYASLISFKDMTLRHDIGRAYTD